MTEKLTAASLNLNKWIYAVRDPLTACFPLTIVAVRGSFHNGIMPQRRTQSRDEDER